ncbi:MAG TPA: DnaJ domain-containing protein [Anaerolineae bacterium]
MPLPDYYSVLMVDPNADQDIIDAAYRRLAARFHPDVNKSRGAVERMRVINEAYAILGELPKRQMYDTLRKAQSEHSNSNGQPPLIPVICANCHRQFMNSLAARDMYLCPFCGRQFFTRLGAIQQTRLVLTKGMLSSKYEYRVALALPDKIQVIQFQTPADVMVQLRERDTALFHFDAERRLLSIQNLTLRRLWRVA